MTFLMSDLRNILNGDRQPRLMNGWSDNATISLPYYTSLPSHNTFNSNGIPLALRTIQSESYTRLRARKSMTHCRVPPEPSVRARPRNERPLFHSIGRFVRVEERQQPHTTYT
ncbi:hypothetical protein EVAR_13238_1 [Eumeta japonica]|uniref:Uncharacterized protein n=1 Tax=Eumeta variegata TaxID=151549 RepID=A0A4C1TSD6_EUMVA|nr:hypothetical protein EVAR_13238_1 [Eumeta japonica]